MKRCFILSGLLVNLTGVVLLFFGMKVDKKGIAFSTSKDPKDWEISYPVNYKPAFLKLGLALVCLGIMLQIIGTY